MQPLGGQDAPEIGGDVRGRRMLTRGWTSLRRLGKDCRRAGRWAGSTSQTTARCHSRIGAASPVRPPSAHWPFPSETPGGSIPTQVAAPGAILQGQPSFAEKLASSQHLGGFSVGTGICDDVPGLVESTWRPDIPAPGSVVYPGCLGAERPSRSTRRTGETEERSARRRARRSDRFSTSVDQTFVPAAPSARPHTTSASRTERHASATRPLS